MAKMRMVRFRLGAQDKQMEAETKASLNSTHHEGEPHVPGCFE
jgi:hypothetical protein